MSRAFTGFRSAKGVQIKRTKSGNELGKHLKIDKNIKAKFPNETCVCVNTAFCHRTSFCVLVELLDEVLVRTFNAELSDNGFG